MDYDLSDEHRALRDTVREFAEGVIAPVAEELDRESRFPVDIVRQLGEMGLMGVPFDAELGGGGADTLAYAITIEELTRIDSSVGVTVAAHTSLGTSPIAPVRQRRAEGPLPARPVLRPQAGAPSA